MRPSSHVRPTAGGAESLNVHGQIAQQWAGNPLAQTGSWTASGRRWYTECDAATTGKNGCRSYIWASTIGSTVDSSGNRVYFTMDRWLFNNIVRFA